MTKTKFVESKKKYPKSARMTALNFIVKELFYFNLIFERISKDESNEKEAPQNRKSVSYKRSRKGLDFFIKNNNKKLAPSNLSILQKKDIYDISKKAITNKLKYSLNANLLLYKLSNNNRNSMHHNRKLNVKEKVNQQYLNKAMSLIHENKYKKDLSSHTDCFELLSKITDRENIETILRTFILEGETLLFSEYFNNNYRRININSQDEKGNTFLILSVRQGLDYITKILLEKGVDVDIQNKLGNTALHYALSAKNYLIADLLKKFGAKEDCYNIYGFTPWDIVGKSIEAD
jgi:ankyrin repeat protein